MELTYTIYAHVTMMPSRAYILKNSHVIVIIKCNGLRYKLNL